MNVVLEVLECVTAKEENKMCIQEVMLCRDIKEKDKENKSKKRKKK